MERNKLCSVLYPRPQLLPFWLLVALDFALFSYQLEKSWLVDRLYILPCGRNAVVASNGTSIFLLGSNQKEADKEENGDSWMPFPERRVP